jgi:5-methylcytosine-specific restriction enzyme subunit McrC
MMVSVPIVVETLHRPAIKLVGRIPVRNIWLLMLYASSYYRSQGTHKIALEENPDNIQDLVAEILAHIVERRLKRNLSFNYQTRYSILNRMRGRIDQLTTTRHNLLARGMLACKFEDFTVNTTRNRYVRAALETIARIVYSKSLAHRCKVLANTLKALGVSGDKPSRTELSTDRINRNEVADREMVAAAMLAFNMALPTEEEGDKLFPNPEREEKWVRLLFEKAIGGFYDVVLSKNGWNVEAGKPLNWQIEQKTEGIDKILPLMKSDIILSSYVDGRRIIIDTKFTEILVAGRFREASIRSGYLYQIYAYIRSQEDDKDPLTKNASGLLLHPAIGKKIDETVVIQGHAIRFATVDLAADVLEIRKQLIDLINFPLVPE